MSYVTQFSFRRGKVPYVGVCCRGLVKLVICQTLPQQVHFFVLSLKLVICQTLPQQVMSLIPPSPQPSVQWC